MKSHSGLYLRTGFVAAALVMLCLGCLPKRVYWSPDGQRAVILAGGGMAYVTDADGKLSPPNEKSFEQVAWFPDSLRVVAVEQEKVANWGQAARFLPDSRRKELIQLAEPLRKEILAHEGRFNNWRPAMAAGLTDGELGALWLYVRENRPEGLKEKLGDEWQQYRDLNLAAKIVRLCAASSEGLRPDTVVFSSLDGMARGSLRISPDGRKLAFVMQYVTRPSGSVSQPLMGNTDKTYEATGTLIVCEINPQAEIRKVAEAVAWRPDWTPDGRSLVYAAASQKQAGNDALALGSINRRTVCDEQGKLLKPTQFKEPDNLAGIMYFPDTKVVCLRDGRILFSALPVQLPATASDMPPGPALFALAPERQPTVTRMIAQDATNKSLDDGFKFGVFEISPDGRNVTMLNIGDGRGDTYAFAGGRLETILTPSAGQENKGLLEQPTWRNSEELSFVVPPGHEWGSPQRPELVLCPVDTKQARCISKSWPDELMNSFKNDSPKEKNESRPATGTRPN